MIRLNPFRSKNLFTLEMSAILLTMTYVFSFVCFFTSKPIMSLPLCVLLGLFIGSTGYRIKKNGFFYTDNWMEFLHLLTDITLVTGISFYGKTYDFIPVLIALTAFGFFNDNKIQIASVFILALICFQLIRNDFLSIKNLSDFLNGLFGTAYNLGIIAGYSIIVKVLYRQKYQLQVQQKVIADKHADLEAAYEELFQNAILREEMAAKNERLRLNGELHDHMGHAMASSLMQLQYIHKIIDKDTEMAKNQITEIRGHLKESYEEIRRFVRETPHNVSGYLVENEPISLDQFITRLGFLESKMRLKFVIKNDTHQSEFSTLKLFEGHQAVHLFRIIQELATNAVKHGEASELSIHFKNVGNKFNVCITDNGRGCDRYEQGFGLESISNRVKEIEGALQIESSLGNGFKAIISFENKEVLNISA